MKVAVTGGGTGGHTLPVLAVINKLEKINSELKVFFVGSRFGIESRLIPKMGIKYYGISSGKFRRYHRSMLLNIIDPTTLFNNMVDFFRFFSGIKEAREILSHEKPDVLFAKGGYVSLPVAFAARTLKIPIVAHESDVVMGLANRKISSFAAKVCVSFPKKYYSEIEETKLIETGNPVRDDILMGNGEGFKKEIGFEKNRKTILILGGSQGSQFINEIVFDVINEILEKYQLIWIAGEREAELISYKTEKFNPELKEKLKIFGFVTSEMADVYAASDLVISRSGSNVLFELAALGKPAILIPHDVSPGSHQFENARLFSRSGAAYLFKQENLTGHKLLHQIEYLLNDQKELNNMSENMKKWANKDASEKVAQEVYKTGVEKIEQTAKNKREE